MSSSSRLKFGFKGDTNDFTSGSFRSDFASVLVAAADGIKVVAGVEVEIVRSSVKRKVIVFRRMF